MFRVACLFIVCALSILLPSIARPAHAQDLQTGASFLDNCSLIDFDVGIQKVFIDHGHLAIYMQYRDGNQLGLIILEIPAPSIASVVIGIDLANLRTLSLNDDLGYHFDCKTPGCIKTAYRQLDFDTNFKPIQGPTITRSINAFRWNTCDLPTSKKALQGIGAHLIQSGFTLENKYMETVLRAPP